MRLISRLAGAPRRALRGEVGRNSAWALASSGIAALAVFAETVILAQYLEPRLLGVFLLVLAYPEALQQLFDFRLRDAMTKYLAEFMSRRQYRHAVALIKLFWVIDVAVAALALLIVVATAGIAAALFVPEPGTAHLMRIYAIGVFLASLDSASGPVLRVMDRFGLAFGASSSGYVGRLGLVATAVALDGGLEALVWARVGGELLITLFQVVAALGVLRAPLWAERRTPVSLLRNRSVEIRSFLLNTNFAGVLRLASTKLDTLLVGLLASPTTVGIYKIGLQFSKVPLLVSDSLYLAVYPTFARDFALGRIRHMREIARRSSIYVAGLGLPIAIALAVKGDALIAAVVGESFRSAGDILAVCVLGILPYLIFFWVSPLLLTLGYAATRWKIAGIGVVAQIASIIALVPLLGAMGAAIGFALNYIIFVTLALRFIYRKRFFSTDE